jgi:hypothetical protein
MSVFSTVIMTYVSSPKRDSSHGADWASAGRAVFGPWLALALILAGCADTEDSHPAAYQYNATPVASTTNHDACASPNTGCSCDEPGTIVDCETASVRVGDYTTCYAGSRICTDDRKWGACVSDQVIAQSLD